MIEAEDQSVSRSGVKLLPWETSLLINIVTKFDSCMAMPIRELGKEAVFWKCKGRLKSSSRYRRALTNAIVKKWVVFAYSKYMESVKAGAEVSSCSSEHFGWVQEMRDRGLMVEDFWRS